ncbi:metallophosphoesterase [Oscillochloris trichoides DG-6]|uniref:Metallophosphoesterase n=1 Tax=Oscillochloris trichoides DG-6 TaxID=765420 RepID=E1IAV3_9CHLR|nr:metallophosphoesterase family protein [Oscillochloris trichoides]EFO81709.1 metallophosphoesterase [Oscillochloris trichoides DG-6]
MAQRILHISDLHAGPPFRPQVAQHLAAQAQRLKPDLVVISGDFVQRADFASQWRAAKELRAALPTPQLVVAGNHDVPLFNLHLRLLNPMGRYRRHISRDLNPVCELPGVVVVGANTAHGLTFDGGRLSRSQSNTLRRILAGYGPEVYKVVVWHHPVVTPPGGKRDRTMQGAHAAMQLLDECGVDLLLSGHLHVFALNHTRDLDPSLRRGTLLCQCGTSTSRRGHGSEHGKNSCNLITLEDQQVRITHMLYDDAAAEFVPAAEHTFPRL